ncbi:hypothetical protein [Cellulomonas chengniuliangii]|uniref:hypothetical protein n=1 Tax=Cellulomonas chengniuliangii TaxID=2968084 RepID=UPI001D0EC945|nr:hypothetical protein [Cellulomonas chengniuliangii]MCC2318462.1 hypothetical protein [Cellulomonas chengniuliangii]
MSDRSHDPDAGAQDEGGYGYPTLEQEVTPEVLEAGAESGGPGDSARSDAESAEDSGEDEVSGSEDDTPAPGELVEDPPAVEPTD